MRNSSRGVSGELVGRAWLYLKAKLKVPAGVAVEESQELRIGQHINIDIKGV
jgi:hypothetical protein